MLSVRYLCIDHQQLPMIKSATMHRQSISPLLLRSAKTLAMVLALCAMLVRVAIPAGFMPDPAAAHQNKVRLTLCMANGTVLTKLINASGNDEDVPSLIQQCPFGMVSAPSVMPMPTVVRTVLLARAPASAPLVSQPSLPVQPATGPPLGSRAPPSSFL